MRKAPNSFLDEEKSLACVHCGLCLSACPTYLETGNENDSPRGRIYLMRALQQERLPVRGTVTRHLDLCLGCRACETACPSGVRYGELLESTRDHLEHHQHRPLFQSFLRKILIEKMIPHPARMRWALLPARLLNWTGLGVLFPKRIREALSLVPSPMPRSDLKSFYPAPAKFPQGRLGFIRGCVMPVMFGPTHQSSIRLLNETGRDVLIPREQGCCGALYAHGGNLNEARACARRNIAAFENLRLEAIVINAAGCGSTLKEYGHLLKDDPAWAERARTFSSRVMDLTQWLAAHPPADAASQEAASENGVVTCHDACHLAHAQGITLEPRTLIRQRAGEQYVEMAEADLCCGSAGSYNLTEPEMAERLQQRKIQNILKSGARTVVTTNPGCLLQIQAGLNKAGASHVRAVHIADYLGAAPR